MSDAIENTPSKMPPPPPAKRIKLNVPLVSDKYKPDDETAIEGPSPPLPRSTKPRSPPINLADLPTPAHKRGVIWGRPRKPIVHKRGELDFYAPPDGRTRAFEAARLTELDEQLIVFLLTADPLCQAGMVLDSLAPVVALWGDQLHAYLTTREHYIVVSGETVTLRHPISVRAAVCVGEYVRTQPPLSLRGKSLWRFFCQETHVDGPMQQLRREFRFNTKCAFLTWLVNEHSCSFTCFQDRIEALLKCQPDKKFFDVIEAKAPTLFCSTRKTIKPLHVD